MGKYKYPVELHSVNVEPQKNLDTFLFRLFSNNVIYPLNTLWGAAQPAPLGALPSALHGYFTTDAPALDGVGDDREIQAVKIKNPLQILYPEDMSGYNPEADPPSSSIPEDLANVVDNTYIIKFGNPLRCAETLYPGDEIIVEVGKLGLIALRNPNFVAQQPLTFVDVEITIVDKDE